MYTMEIGKTYQIKLEYYKSKRHYGGREITTYIQTTKAKLVAIQEGHQPYIMEITEEGTSYPKGHKIAISKQYITDDIAGF